MTESNPAPDPSISAPSVPDAQTGPVPADAPVPDAPKAPAKKAAKKAPAKKAAEAPKPEVTKADPRSLYLPALPDGFEYTGITATGKNGETLNISPAAGADAAAGSATLSFEGAGLNREQNFADMKSAISAGAKAAKAMSKIAAREAELAKVREEALDL